MDKAVGNALLRKKELERELAEIEQFLKLYDRFSSGTVAEQNDAHNSPKAVENAHQEDALDDGAPRRRLRTKDIADLAERLIAAEGRPLSRTELVARMEANGLDLPSADKARYIGTILWRNRDRFVNLAGRGYQLVSALEPEELANVQLLNLITRQDADVAQELEIEHAHHAALPLDD
jgi:hypothetical protein